MGKKKNSYSFLVHREGNVDAIKVSKEVREDKPHSVGFLLTSDVYNGAVLCLYQDFLNKFKDTSEFSVLGEDLCPNWGLDAIPVFDKENEQFLLVTTDKRIFRVLHCDKFDISYIRKEINEAKEAIKRVQIIVKIL